MVDKEELLRLLPYDFKTDIYIIKISKFKTNLLFNFKINILIDYDINSKEDIHTIFKNIKKINIRTILTFFTIILLKKV